MNRWVRCLIPMAGVLAFEPDSATAAAAEAIDYRQHIMQTLGEHTQALSMIVQGKGPAENLTVHTEALAMTATQVLKAFEQEAPGGHAKSAVWQNWKDFSDRLTQLKTRLTELDKVAKAGGVAAVAPKMKPLLTCQNCHDSYRSPSPAAPAQAQVADATQYREHVMRALDAQSAALGQILSTEVVDTNLASHLEVLSVTASGALKSFEARVPGGEARPEVWSNWADFSRKMNEFSQGIGAAARIAREQGKDAALSVAIDALSCKGCHDTYRQKK